MSNSRVARGRATQRLVALYLKDNGWPYATSKGAGESGVDIENLPGLSVEVKATPGDNTGALRQAVRNAGTGLPLVVWRPNGYGPERIEDWPTFLRLADLVDLLHAAGYGDPEVAS
jgi:hypothetical protein